MSSNAELWWENVPGASQLVDDMASQLMRMESVLLYTDEDFPWPDSFRMSVKDRVLRSHPDYALDVCDARLLEDMEPGRWILDYFGGERIFCLPSEDPAKLALREGMMHNRIIWVTNCQKKEQVNKWLGFARAMRKEEPSLAGCIALILDKKLHTHSMFQTIDVAEYYGEYDLSFFAASIISRMKMKPFEKQYLSELSVQLAFGSAEHCAELTKNGIELLQNPEEVARWAKNSKCAHAIWQAQMRTVFASIEEKKYDLIQENQKAVQPLLGTIDDFGNRIETISDIELRHLIHARKKGDIFLPEKTAGKIDILHTSRNQLAHHKVLAYDELKLLQKVLGTC